VFRLSVGDVDLRVAVVVARELCEHVVPPAGTGNFWPAGPTWRPSIETAAPGGSLTTSRNVALLRATTSASMRFTSSVAAYARALSVQGGRTPSSRDRSSIEASYVA
jgi:hypothetical protein